MNQKNIPLSYLRLFTAEILACAVFDLFPGVLLDEGENTPTGFYYDFAFKQPINEEYFPQIEERMRSLIMDELQVRHLTMMRKNAMEMFQHQGQFLKVEQLAKMHETVVELMQLGEFYDLCPIFLKTTKSSTAFKLLSLIPPKKQSNVTRIIGTVWPDQSSLKKFLKAFKEAQKQNHMILGQKLNIFAPSFHSGEEYWLWSPKGAQICEKLFQWWSKEQIEQGFQIVSTPSLVSKDLLKKAGLSEQAAFSPSFTIEEIDYAIAPSFSLPHALLFASKSRISAEIPIKFAECGKKYLSIKHSQLFGMLQTRECTTDMAHLFCSEEKVVEQLISSLRFIKKIIRMFDFEAKCYLCVSLHQKKAEKLDWEKAINWIAEGAKEVDCEYTTEATLDLKGPLLEFRLSDALGNEWCGPSIGIDIGLPRHLQLKYMGKTEKQPVMVVQSLFGSFERFIALLLERSSGNLPEWLSGK